MPALAAERPQASACMRSGRMPISIAALRSSATASSWLPTAVRVSSRCMPRVSAPATPPATSCGTLEQDAAEIDRAGERRRRQRHEIGREDPERGVAQQQREAEGRQDLRQHRPAHHLADEAEIDERRRAGTARPPPPGRRPPGRHADPSARRERHIHAEHDELAMGEVDEVHHAPDQRQPGGEQRVDARPAAGR